jgi:hypothetical protein
MIDLHFVVLPGNRTRNQCSTSVVCNSRTSLKGNVWLIEEETERIYPGYIWRLDLETIEVFVMLDTLVMQSELELTLPEIQPIYQPESFLLLPMEAKKIEGNLIEIRKNRKLFTVFHSGDAIRPYFMPLNGPFGDPVTREYPIKKISGGSEDHIHHRSCWSAWGDIRLGNEQKGTDHWGEGMAAPEEVRKISICEAGYTLSHLQVKLQWMDREGEKPQMDEERNIFIYNILGQETLIDVRLKFTARYDDITFADTKEGGFVAVRVADSYRGEKGGRIENSNGSISERECWGKKAFWCDYSGKVKNNLVGITLMDHPENLGYPTYWHVRDYGLMAANPLGVSEFKANKKLDGSFVLKKSQILNLQYRIFVHAGQAHDAHVNERYRDFISPPELKFLGE